MKRSFWGNGEMDGGGGGMLRTVQRAVRAGVGGAARDPFSHSSTSYTSISTKPPNHKPTSLSLSSSTASSPFSPFNHVLSASSIIPSCPPCYSPTSSDGLDWDCIEDEIGFANDDDFVFGSVPSRDEVLYAVSALQQVLHPTHFSQFLEDDCAFNLARDVAHEISSPTGSVNGVSSVGSESDWIEPSLQLCYPRMPEHHGSFRVYDVFHLLRTEPSIERMVISLSCDKAVWDAVMNNEVVQELRASLSEVQNNAPNSHDGREAATNTITWILEKTKAKVMEIIEKLAELVNELFQIPEDEKAKEVSTDVIKEKLRTSFMLAVMVLLIVVVSRAHWA